MNPIHWLVQDLIPGSGTPNNECSINRTNLKTTKLHLIHVQKRHPWLYSIFTNIIYHYFVISSRKHRAQLLVWETSFMEHFWSHECLDCLIFMIWKILEPKLSKAAFFLRRCLNQNLLNLVSSKTKHGKRHPSLPSDGRNPAPVDMVNIPLFTGFYISHVVVWDFWTINRITPPRNSAPKRTLGHSEDPQNSGYNNLSRRWTTSDTKQGFINKRLAKR